jgi:hypothetical protein
VDRTGQDQLIFWPPTCPLVSTIVVLVPPAVELNQQNAIYIFPNYYSDERIALAELGYLALDAERQEPTTNHNPTKLDTASMGHFLPYRGYFQWQSRKGIKKSLRIKKGNYRRRVYPPYPTRLSRSICSSIQPRPQP